MIILLKVCLKAIFHHQNINLHPTCTDFAAKVGRKGSGHSVVHQSASLMNSLMPRGGQME